MDKKRFTYREYKKLVDNKDVFEIYVNCGRPVFVHKLVRCGKGSYPVPKNVLIKKYLPVTERDFRNIMRQINKQILKENKKKELKSRFIIDEHIKNSRIIAITNKAIAEPTMITRKLRQVKLEEIMR